LWQRTKISMKFQVCIYANKKCSSYVVI